LRGFWDSAILDKVADLLWNLWIGFWVWIVWVVSFGSLQVVGASREEFVVQEVAASEDVVPERSAQRSESDSEGEDFWGWAPGQEHPKFRVPVYNSDGNDLHQVGNTYCRWSESSSDNGAGSEDSE